MAADFDPRHLFRREQVSTPKGPGGFSHRLRVAALVAVGAFYGSAAVAEPEGGTDGGKDPADWTETDVGIPVTDPLTTQKCGMCHTPDAKGNLSRISWTRATPEAWAQTIKRMVKLNGLSISPTEARSIVKYLATNHGLAPEEAKPVMYFAERRIQDETIIPNDTLRQTCASCHAFAQPMSTRRSHREWALLQNMHEALYATAQRTYEAPDQGHGHGDAYGGAKPMQQGLAALDWLTQNAPLHTADWAAWLPGLHAPVIAGKWLVSANLSGRDRFVGEQVITPKSPGSDEFTTSTSLHSLTDGHILSRTGLGLVYAGYSWRGTSQGVTNPGDPEDPANKMRETLWIAPEQAAASGRWYWGDYHEFGLDVTMVRENGASMLIAASPRALKTGVAGQEVHLYGADLPGDLGPGDVNIGGGVTVRKVLSASPHELVVAVDVSAQAIPGIRNVSVHGAILQKALSVYSHIDYLKVTPDTALAHLGGIKFEKGYQQFAAVGWSDGPDGKRNTNDDFPIKPIDVSWSLAEMPTVTYDDDIAYVGQINAVTGLFTPNVEGPDPKRRFMRNNYGEVWAVATAKADHAADGKLLEARSYLVITVPAYKRWDQPEVSQ